ncbi:protein mono-ADP-ribosyltransferase PARP10 [Coregonus clupeaformis]|uniref:protein mono-ADP-ribosyltransferase PARP10 n=1 Tax=Coregonus clupeaformis TaxID=59861 RepID=UPI001BE005A9|nr:protein mono-ADP-ribosyltransferase PARP10 [Coregonus clupeaformis]
MSVESQENRTVEVLGVPEEVEYELLYLYFENKRRSGGGSLVSVKLEGSRALLLFEEAEVASRVLSKRPHVLNNAELTVRKPACKDPRRLLLRGVNPTTSQDLVELYVENMMGMDIDDYTLYPSPGRDLVLVHFHQAFNKDFQKLCTKISKKPLDGAQIVLEQIDQTDSILMENLHPSITADMLNLYLESQRGGRGEVKEVTMRSEGVARVSFLDFDSVERVLNQSHKMEETDLTVSPYFSFLQSEDSSSSPLTSPLTSLNGTSDSSTTNTQQTVSGGQSQTGSLPAASTSDCSQSSHQATSEPLVPTLSHAAAAQGGMDDLTSTPEPMSSHISVPDPVKLTLLQLSPLPQSLQLAHQGCSIQIREDGVHMAGPDRLVLEQLKNAVLEFLGGVTQAHLTFDPEKAHFLAKQEVKDRLLQTLKEKGLPSMYTVSDCVIVVTSLSLSLVSQACSMLKTLLSDFSIPVDREYECMLYAQEWTSFLQSLGLCSAKVSERGQIDVLTLRGLEEEKQAKIVEFLSTPIETEAIISMEPGMLKYIQTHRHQLLADMNQVSIFPLDAHDICGLRIQGNAGACQMADEVLRGVVSSTETRTITVKQPGVARFLIQEGEGTSILREMQTKFQVYINMEKVHWEPLENEDIFEAAWNMSSHQSFQRSSLDGSLQASTSILTHTIQTSNNLSASDRGRIEEAKRLFSAIDETVDSGLSSLTRTTGMEEDLYTAREPMALSTYQGPDRDSANIKVEEEAPLPMVEGGGSDDEAATAPVVTQDGELSWAMQLSTTLEEEAQMSLAIQYSMETTKRSLADEEEELQKVLELSRKMTKMTRHDGDGCAMPIVSLPAAGSHLDQAVQVSLQEAIQSANTATIFVFAGYSCDLIRVDIALNKRITIKQHVEKLEHRSLRSLSQYHRWCLDLIKRKHAVEITIQGTTATISGFKDFVIGAMPDMKLLLRRISTTTSDADILRTVQWVWHDPVSSGMEIPYAPEATVFMENAWKMRQKKIDILLNNQLHFINFEKMQEYNVASGKSVTISRKMLSSDIQDEDYSLLSNLPETSRVNKDSDEFKDVLKDFYDSIHEYHNEIRIIKVEKLMNRLLYNQYRLKKASINQSATDPEVERTLYHGTSESSMKEICVHGFNRSFCGKNATVYGQGVYFAVNSALSVQDQYSPPNADGHKFVFVTKVLTGNFTQGSHSMKAAPLKESADIPLRYDSVADKTDNPSLFVIFNDTQAYPEYLITCQKIHR